MEKKTDALVESRIRWKVYVRFGGECLETDHRNMIRRWVLSLHNISDMNQVLRAHPSGAFATALSTRKNAIYRNLMLNSIDIVNDIRQVCLSGVKMTEKQRIDIVFNIRPKLVAMNRQLRRLTRTVKYTTLGDVWADIEQLQREEVDKLTITRDCMQRWKRKAKLGF